MLDVHVAVSADTRGDSVIMDLRTLHLGDVLMALPAMRVGDAVIARPQHRVPGAPIVWLNAGDGVMHGGRGHATEAWLATTGRIPVRHELLPPEPRTLTVIAPAVADKAKQWHAWDDLCRALPHAVVVGVEVARSAWMSLLNRAHTVICPDTGTAHMADALGCQRVIALHGVSANWPRCAPYWTRGAHCVVRESTAQIAVADVLERVHG